MTNTEIGMLLMTPMVYVTAFIFVEKIFLDKDYLSAARTFGIVSVFTFWGIYFMFK